MNFQIIDQFDLPDHSQRMHLKVQKNELLYVVYFLESFEGWCNCTTINPQENILQVDFTSSYKKKMWELIEFLINYNLKSEEL